MAFLTTDKMRFCNYLKVSKSLRRQRTRTTRTTNCCWSSVAWVVVQGLHCLGRLFVQFLGRPFVRGLGGPRSQDFGQFDQNVVIISIADLKKAYTIAGTDVLNHSMLSSQMPCPVRTVWCVPWININVVRQASIHS